MGWFELSEAEDRCFFLSEFSAFLYQRGMSYSYLLKHGHMVCINVCQNIKKAITHGNAQDLAT